MSEAAIPQSPPLWSPGPVAIVVMLTGAMFSGLIFVAVGPVLPLLSAHFGGGAEGARLAQYMLTMPSVGLVIGGLLGGWIFDRIGPNHVLPPAFIAYGICGAGGAWLEDPTLMLISRGIIGFCACVISLGTTVMIAGSFGETQRAKMLGYKNAVASGVGIGGTLVAGTVAEVFGWRAAFGVYAVALLFVLPAILSTRTFPVPAQREAGSGGYWRDLGRNWFIYATIVIFAVIVMGPMTQVPFLLHEQGIEGPQKVSFVLVCASVGSTVGAFLFGHILARLGMVGTFLAMMAVWAASMLILGTAMSAEHAALGCFVSGISSGIFVVYMANALVTRVAPQNRGRAVGFLYVSLFAGDSITPSILLPLAETFGRHTTFFLLALPCAVAFIVMAVSAGVLRRGAAVPSPVRP